MKNNCSYSRFDKKNGGGKLLPVSSKARLSTFNSNRSRIEPLGHSVTANSRIAPLF